MLSFDDPRWRQLKGGSRRLYDPRPVLRKLEAGDAEEAWRELWEELHHQGDVGEASYAAVPHLVRIHRQRGVHDWNTYAITACIELARGGSNDPEHGKQKNPEVPDWLEPGYFTALKVLVEIGLKELPLTSDRNQVRGILCILALGKQARTYARFLLDYSEDEMLDLESAASGS